MWFEDAFDNRLFNITAVLRKIFYQYVIFILLKLVKMSFLLFLFLTFNCQFFFNQKQHFLMPELWLLQHSLSTHVANHTKKRYKVNFTLLLFKLLFYTFLGACLWRLWSWQHNPLEMSHSLDILHGSEYCLSCWTGGLQTLAEAPCSASAQTNPDSQSLSRRQSSPTLLP